VSSWESRQISSLLDQAEVAQPWLKNASQSETKTAQPPAAAAAPIAPRSAAPAPYSTTITAFEPASDPVLPDEVPETTASVPEPTVAREHQPTPAPLEKLTGVTSDRDLIVLEDAPTRTPACPPQAAVPPAAAEAARKVEFRQLFAKLRRG
jgi:hypothetical protein